jgi:regulatory protein
MLKMETYDLTDEDKSRIIKQLIAHRFIDEKRYCLSFVRDRSKRNKWGKFKICFELVKKQIPDEIIQDAISTLQDDDIDERLVELLVRKKRTTRYSSEFELRQKLLKFAYRRGFSVEETEKALSSVLR